MSNMPVLLLLWGGDGTGFARFASGKLCRIGPAEWAYYQSQNVPSTTVTDKSEHDHLAAEAATFSLIAS